MPTDRFMVPGAPIPKARARVTRSGHAFTPKTTMQHEQRIRDIAKAIGVQMHAGPVVMTIDFYMPTKRRADLTNLAKAIEDALNPRIRLKRNKAGDLVQGEDYDPWGAYPDDDAIVCLTLRKFLDRDNPRTVVEITDA